MSKQDSSRMSR